MEAVRILLPQPSRKVDLQGSRRKKSPAAFAARKVAVSKNLVYNVLSLMFKRKLVRKDDGRYYPLAATVISAKPAPAAAPPKKRRISEEGMRRIIAATKKRWALQRAGKGKK